MWAPAVQDERVSSTCCTSDTYNIRNMKYCVNKHFMTAFAEILFFSPACFNLFPQQMAVISDEEREYSGCWSVSRLWCTGRTKCHNRETRLSRWSRWTVGKYGVRLGVKNTAALISKPRVCRFKFSDFVGKSARTWMFPGVQAFQISQVSRAEAGWRHETRWKNKSVESGQISTHSSRRQCLKRN